MMKKLLSFFAMAGLLVACQPEDLETAFEVAPAKVTVTVHAIDVNNPATEVSAEVSASEGTVEGNVITILGSKSLTARELTVNAKFEGATYSTKLNIAALRAGGVAAYDVNIVVGKAVSEITFKVNDVPAAPVAKVAYFNPGDGHALVDHAGKSWAKNLTEYLLNGTVTYTSKVGQFVDESTVVLPETSSPVYNVVKAYVDAYKAGKGTTTEEKYNFTVSAWSYYTVFQTVTSVKHTVEILADGAKVGSLEYSVFSNQVEYEEIANPEGHGHYVYGHGHGHGGANAGGGIVLPE